VIAGSAPSVVVEVIDGEEDGSNVEMRECAICLVAPPDAIMLPCGHTDCCLACAEEYLTREDRSLTLTLTLTLIGGLSY